VLGLGLLVAFATGVGLQVGPALRRPQAALDRGFASMMGALGQASSATGRAVAQTLTTAPSSSRPSLLASLRVEDQQAVEQAEQGRVDALGTSGSQARFCLGALEERATASGEILRGVQTLLGGPTGQGSGSAAAQQTALGDLEGALRLLGAADDLWGRCRLELARQPGRARLGSSRWLAGEGIWSDPALAAWVPVVADAPGLQPSPGITLGSPTTLPAAVAETGGVGPTYQLVALRRLGVRVVVQNDGNVVLPDVTLRAQLTPTGPLGRAGSVATTLSLPVQGIRTVSLPPLAVTPGADYLLVVQASTTPQGGLGPVTASSPTLSLGVAQEATVTAVVASANPVRVDQPVTYTATVTPALSGSPPPPGTVSFQDNGVTVPGCGAVALHQGVATCTLAYAHSGLHSITVTYPGTASLAGSVSPAITVTVTPAGRSA